MRRAIAFLTPFGGAQAPAPGALRWFPVVGALLGLGLGGVWWLARQAWPPAVAGAVVVVADLAATGLLHADGLVDSGDGLLPHLTRERRLEVMTSPEVGAFGVAVAVGTLLLRWAALASLRPAPLLLAGLWCLSRSGMAFVAVTQPYARSGGGLASAFLGGAGRRLTLAVLVAGGAASLVLAALWRLGPGLVAVAVAVAAGASVVLLARRRIGGFTGDVLGAAGLLAETAGLVAAGCPLVRVLVRPTSAYALAAAAGLLADRALGEPPAALHPVAAFGRAMAAAEARTYRDSRLAGALHAVSGVGGAAALGATLAGRSSKGRSAVATAVATTLVVAGRSLAEAARGVGAPLAAGDLAGARSRLPALVGRDPERLGPAEIARAVIESVAENTVDAVVAPALWATLAGAPGALGYRAANTLDAMVGHRSPQYERFGWASARLDDVANWVPARVTACLVAAVRPGGAPAVWRAVRRDAPAHPSPNAGVAEAAFAAALGVRLGGTNTYAGRAEDRGVLGDGPEPGAKDIERAVQLSRDVTLALAAALAAGALAGRGRR